MKECFTYFGELYRYLEGQPSKDDFLDLMPKVSKSG